MPPMLEVRNLTKYYGALAAVRDVSFQAPSGQVLGYLGPNGSGKSTTVRMITGLLPPTSGQILWHGRSIHDDLVAFRRSLGYVPEEPHLYTHLTAPEFLHLVGGLRDMDARVIARRCDAMLEVLGLAGDRHASLTAYSKGMRQKVLIAAALMHDPELVIVDEPFSGLDVSAALMLRSVFATLARNGRTVLMSSHVMEVVEQLCSEVVILFEGRVVAHDRVERLRGLQAERSLEHVFVQLAVPVDLGDAARQFLEAMRS